MPSGSFFSGGSLSGSNIDSAELLATLQQQEFEQSSVDRANAFTAEQNQLNRDFQTNANRIAMDFESDQVRLNRNWQEYMSNTAYQRAVEDAKAAGLNPILMASNGGAAVTSGAMASGVSSAGSSAAGIAASGTRANTDYTGKRQLQQTYITTIGRLLSSVISGAFQFSSNAMNSISSFGSSFIS